MVEIKKYNSSYKDIWNNFLLNSRLDSFIINREFMEYHSERFCDSSLLYYKENKLIAILPGNIYESTFYSHQGLSFGGLVLSKNTSIFDVIEIFEESLSYFKRTQITKVIYKVSPSIYHRQPMQEDLYCLHKFNFRKEYCNLSSTIFPLNKIAFKESRKGGIRKARRLDLIINQSDNINSFWKVLKENLQVKHKTLPVHTSDEMELLMKRFPKNILLFTVSNAVEVFAGTVLFISERVVHVQYISASEYGKENGALDYLFDYLIKHYCDNNYIFDFGHSNEDHGKKINEGLIFQKEGFGARGLINEVYSLTL